MKQIRSPPLCTDKQHFGVWIPAPGSTPFTSVRSTYSAPSMLGFWEVSTISYPSAFPSLNSAGVKLCSAPSILLSRTLIAWSKGCIAVEKGGASCLRIHVRQLIHCRMSIQPCDCNIENRIHLVRPLKPGPQAIVWSPGLRSA